MLAGLSADFSTRLSELEGRIFDLAGAPFNLNSPKQMGEVLFERMGLKSGKKTKGKTGWSTDNEVLTTLAEEHEIARLILDYRGVSKAQIHLYRRPAKPGQPTQPGGCIPPTTRPSPPPAGSPHPTRTCRTFPIRTEEGRRSGMPSSHRRDM